MRNLPSDVRRPSRRQVLGLGAVGAGAALLVPTARAAVAGGGGPGEPLREPPLLRSRDGSLDVTLRAAPTTTTVAGRTWHVLGYEAEVHDGAHGGGHGSPQQWHPGGFPGPTLVVAPGDTLRVRFVNDLDEPTNLHTHGLHVSGEGDADNVFRMAAAGEELHYRIDVGADHHAGTNWYHPHLHGRGARQLFGGLAGALLVQSPREARGVRGVSRDRVMLLSSHQVDAGGQVRDPLSVRQNQHTRLVNGQLDPVLDIAPGETQRWRLVNTSVNEVYRLRLDGLDVVRVAADGNPYRRARPLTEVVLAAGQRADLLVTGREAGTFALETRAFDVGFGVVLPAARLATVRCEGRRVIARPVEMPALLEPFDDLRGQRVDVRRELSMTMTGGFGFDGTPHTAGRIDQVVRLGDLEEWTVRNPTGLVHPFHIHVNPFIVTHVDGVPVDSPSYEDNVLVDKNGGSVTFLTRFRTFTGRAVYHCHFSTHHDLGMMGVAEIVAPGQQPRGALGWAEVDGGAAEDHEH
ncbi:multicopper oxidase family protein [Aquipuribacter sp. MA13-6]|uniref:multicopper oxidase family protein n=1 Tax=unclassified Aquipuribacter TaxID=2635084 RepID=UPI003EEAAFF7